MFIKRNQRNPLKNAPGNEMMLFPPIFNISPQLLNTVARKFEHGFRRLNRMHSQKKIKKFDI